MIIIVLVLLTIIILRFSVYWKSLDLSHIYKDKHIYFGHRGLRYKIPENTLLSYEAAVKNGLQAIELDVRLSKDREIICSHNIDLERETSGSGFVNELSLVELSRIKVGRKFPPAKQTSIPTLIEVLQKLPYDIIINIEIKSDSYFDFETAKEVADLIISGKIKQSIIVSSFNPLVIRYIKFRSKNTPTGFIYEHKKHFRGVFIARSDCLHPDAEFVDDELIRFCIKRNIKINTWTVNNLHARDWLLEKGVNGIITDNPDLVD